MHCAEQYSYLHMQQWLIHQKVGEKKHLKFSTSTGEMEKCLSNRGVPLSNLMEIR